MGIGGGKGVAGDVKVVLSVNIRDAVIEMKGEVAAISTQTDESPRIVGQSCGALRRHTARIVARGVGRQQIHKLAGGRHVFVDRLQVATIRLLRRRRPDLRPARHKSGVRGNVARLYAPIEAPIGVEMQEFATRNKVFRIHNIEVLGARIDLDTIRHLHAAQVRRIEKRRRKSPVRTHIKQSVIHVVDLPGSVPANADKVERIANKVQIGHGFVEDLRHPICAGGIRTQAIQARRHISVIAARRDPDLTIAVCAAAVRIQAYGEAARHAERRQIDYA